MSRLGTLDDKIKVPILQVFEIISSFQVTASRIQLPYKATVQDDDLYSLKHFVKTAWQIQIQEVHSEIQPYWNFYEEIT